MKRNVYLILITVITILCIIAGTGYHLVRFGLSVAEGLPSFSEFIEAISDWDDDGDDSDDSDDNDDSDNGISTSVDASQKNLDAFSSINADLNVVDLTIQRGNTFSITCKASKKLTPEYKVENNCLTITQYAKAHNALGRKIPVYHYLPSQLYSNVPPAHIHETPEVHQTFPSHSHNSLLHPLSVIFRFQTSGHTDKIARPSSSPAEASPIR